jgi:hypothetical protein
VPGISRGGPQAHELAENDRSRCKRAKKTSMDDDRMPQIEAENASVLHFFLTPLRMITTDAVSQTEGLAELQRFAS